MRFPWQRPAAVSTDTIERTRGYIATQPYIDYDCPDCGGDPNAACMRCAERLGAAFPPSPQIRERVLATVGALEQERAGGGS